jgi:gliding motility-associated-like protein
MSKSAFLKYFLILILIINEICLGSHIAGGDLTITQSSSNSKTFNVTLTLLYDQINGQANESQSVTLGVFKQSNNQQIDQFDLSLYSSNTYLSYTNTSCVNTNVITRVIIYKENFDISEKKYNVPVYFAVENCCRNFNITNINNPDDAGFVYYAEQPALYQNGKYYINSSPKFNELKGDYGCINRESVLDFSANDINGDSLAYELTTPLAGYLNSNSPSSPSYINRGPYPTISWTRNYNATVIAQNGYISLDKKTGILKIKSNIAGLFAFSVKCIEYRNGVKIGEIRRDYQLLFINCLVESSPTIGFVNPKTNTVEYNKSSVFEIRSFKDTFNLDSKDLYKRVNVKFKPINFSLSSITYVDTLKYVTPFDSLITSFRWVDCKATDSTFIYQMYAIVQNSACPQPLTDTILLQFKVLLPINSKPTSALSPNILTKMFQVGDSAYSWQINAYHTDSSVINLQSFANTNTTNGNNDIGLYSIKTSSVNTSNQLSSNFTFEPNCAALKMSDSILFRYIAREKYCDLFYNDTIELVFILKDIPYSADSLKLVNVFTPNDDHLNDVFMLSGMPPDRCDDVFENASIFNRWGVKVFETKDRRINWNGNNVTDGVYFYEVKYQKSNYKGSVEVKNSK